MANMQNACSKQAVGMEAIARRCISLAKHATKERPNGSSFCGVVLAGLYIGDYKRTARNRPKK